MAGGKNKYNRAIIGSGAVVLLILFLSSCSGEKNGDRLKLHLALVGIKGEKSSYSVFVDDTPLLENRSPDEGRPIFVFGRFFPGKHFLRINNNSSGSYADEVLTLEKDIWVRAEETVSAEGARSFSMKVQNEPWGYEFEK